MTFNPASDPRAFRDGRNALQPADMIRGQGSSETPTLMASEGSKSLQRDSPFAKSWAHFLAGGYDAPLSFIWSWNQQVANY